MKDRRLHTLIAGFLLVLCFGMFANTVNAEEKQFYVGIGGSYLFPNFSYDDVIDWDSYGWGLNAKFGYRLARTLYLQIDCDYILPIDGELKDNRSMGGDVEIFTGIVSLKGYFPQFKIVRPYVIAGAGVMHYNVDYNSEVESVPYQLPDDKETSLCLKVGGGVDFFINDTFSVGIEGNYTGGLEEVDEVEYIDIGVGAAFYF